MMDKVNLITKTEMKRISKNAEKRITKDKQTDRWKEISRGSKNEQRGCANTEISATKTGYVAVVKVKLWCKLSAQITLGEGGCCSFAMPDPFPGVDLNKMFK